MQTLLLGLGIGGAAGLSPGPLLVLVVTATLRGGWRSGVAAACAPLVTDTVVVLSVLLVLQHLPPRTVAGLGVAGGLVVIFAAVSTARGAATTRDVPAAATSAPALRQAATINLLSPHPWVAWATVLGPMTVTTWRSTHSAAVGLVAGFYVALIGVKVVLALLVAAGRHRISPVGYRRTLFAASAALALAGTVLLLQYGAALLRP
jgi:threonine/homoserine/homoserine lactone efflux protein